MIFNLGTDYIRTKDGDYKEVEIVDVIGKCIKNVEVGSSKTGKTFVKTTIVAETYKDGTGKFVNLNAFAGSPTYEAIATLSKGQTIRAVGYFTTREFNDKTYEDFNIIWISSELSVFPSKSNEGTTEFKPLTNDADLPF